MMGSDPGLDPGHMPRDCPQAQPIVVDRWVQRQCARKQYICAQHVCSSDLCAWHAGVPEHGRKQMMWWLGGTAFWVYTMVVIGGCTRLTRSGLSMTEWKFSGELGCCCRNAVTKA